MKYKISVIIPVYNTEKYLSRAIESVLFQDFENFEIIIVDDGSTDNSGMISDDYSFKHKNIKVIHKENEGLGFARNTGLKHVSGDYILFLDSDDYIDKYTLKKVYNIAKDTQADITVFNMRKVSEDDNYIIEEKFLKLDKETINLKELGINKYFKDYFFTYKHGHEACNKLYKNDLLQRSKVLFDKNDLICSEDLLFNLKLIPYIDTISSVDESLYNYVQRENSLMNTQYRSHLNYRFTNLINLFNSNMSKFEDINLSKEISILNYNLLNAVLHNESQKYGNKFSIYLKELKYSRDKCKLFKGTMKDIAFSKYCRELLLVQGIKNTTATVIRIFCLLCYINVYVGSLYWYLFMVIVGR